MLSIFATTEYHEQLHQILAKEDRLNELVELFDILEKRPSSSANTILIKKGEIAFPIDWFNVQPPFLLPETVDLTEEHLLGIIFSKLNNFEKTHAYLKDANPSFLKELDFINRMQQGIPIDPSELSSHYSPFEEYRLMHNQAIVRYYAATSENFDLEKTIYFFEEAIKCASSQEHAAFTARQLGLMIIDLKQPAKAVEILESIEQQNISKEAKLEIKNTLCQAWLQQLTIPYDKDLLAKLKTSLWDVLKFYEETNRNAELGLLLLDAAHIANISESFSESLGYVTKAIRLFDEEELTELSANAQLRKGTLLYTWAQNGNPQFFKPAIESYHHALKVFTKEETPDVFADIHHHLAVIYTDMPSEQKKKSIWAGVANSSFNEALDYFTKEEFPYEYGMICNNFGNAFSKFPQAVLSDNFEKALFYYQEALNVRTTNLPYERAITLLNFLEASWSVGNSSDEFNEARFEDMLQKANEVKTLVDDEDMLAEAQKHLDLLKELKQSVS